MTPKYNPNEIFLRPRAFLNSSNDLDMKFQTSAGRLVLSMCERRKRKNKLISSLRELMLSSCAVSLFVHSVLETTRKEQSLCLG